MADYYISPLGSNTAPYDTLAKAANDIATILSRIKSEGVDDNIIYVDDGHYVGGENDIMIDSAYLATLSVYAVNPRKAIIDPQESRGCFVGADGNLILLSGVSIKAGAAYEYVYKHADGGKLDLVNCDFVSNESHEHRGIRSYGGETNLSYCRFFHKGKVDAVTYPVHYTGDSHGTLKWCLSASPDNHICSDEFVFASTGTVNIDHCVLLNSYRNAFLQTAGTVNLTNSILAGGLQKYDADIVQNTAGVLNARNNHIIHNPLDGAGSALTGATVDENNVISNADPKLYCKRPGVVTFAVDDTKNLGYARSLEPTLSAHGYTGAFFCNMSTIDTQAEIDSVREMVADGVMEFANHGWTHSRLTNEHALYFTNSTATNPTVSFDGTTITLDADGTDHDLSMTITETTTLEDVINEFDGVSGWTCERSPTDGQIIDSINLPTKASSLLPMPATAAPCDIDFDRTGIESGLFKSEMSDSKLYAEDIIVNGGGDIIDPQTGEVYACNSFGATYNSGDDATRTAAIAAGYTNYRYNSLGRLEEVWGSVVNVDLYTRICFPTINYIKSATEDDVRQKARAFAFAVKYGGIYVDFLTHDTDDLTVEAVGWVLDEFKDYGVLVMSPQLAARYVRNGPWLGDGGGTYSRSIVMSNDKIENASPCIDAGFWTDRNNNGQADPNGKYIHKLPNMGRDQGAGAPDGATPQLLIGGGLLAGAAYI
jgi:hypothetical protein